MQEKDTFTLAKEYFGRFAAPLELDKRFPRANLLQRLTEPDKSIELRVSLQCDNGAVRSFRAYRVQFNDDRGPYKGGLRFHPVVNLDEMKAMALWMSLKTAVVNIPFGGAKGGISVDYQHLSPAEKERLTKRYALALVDDLGPDKDIPAPDINTGEREMSWIMSVWRMIHGHYNRAIVTGKPLDLGGSVGRRTATGRGVFFVLSEVAKHRGLAVEKSTVAIQGFGNVGGSVARFLHEAGAKVVAVSDVSGAIFNSEGLDIPALAGHCRSGKPLVQFSGGAALASEALLTLDVDILIPAALEHAITPANAEHIQARIIAEGANGPVMPDADNILAAKGITVVPDILCNAGGVIVSYFEWVQNRHEFYWSEEQVDNELYKTITNAYRDVVDLSEKGRTTLRGAAYRIAIERMVEAGVRRGAQ
jgi:glutamate dehydrogenase/leucine dehydrogenase